MSAYGEFVYFAADEYGDSIPWEWPDNHRYPGCVGYVGRRDPNLSLGFASGLGPYVRVIAGKDDDWHHDVGMLLDYGQIEALRDGLSRWLDQQSSEAESENPRPIEEP